MLRFIGFLFVLCVLMKFLPALFVIAVGILTVVVALL